MGIHTDDCRKVAELVGIKVFINEMVAYTDLNVLIDNTAMFHKYNSTWTAINDDIILDDWNVTLVGGVLQVSLVRCGKRSLVRSTLTWRYFPCRTEAL